MRAFAIKRTGKTIWQNMLFDEIKISDSDGIYTGLLFLRKRDAEKYLQTFQYKEFYEVIGVTIDKSEKDNRRKNND